MKLFTGWEYLLIDAANNFGLDKLRFEERLEWATENLDNLEQLAEEKGQWKQRPLYIKAVQAIRKAQKGIPTGHLVGFDAVCSGMQIMSVLTGCEDGARATGLVDPDRRADAYTDCTALMVEELGYHLEGERNKVKKAVMTSLYGSRAEPKKEFGEDTPELAAFYRAMYKLAPGPCDLLEALLQSWQPGALEHAWKLPDGFDAKVKVMEPVEKHLEVDELGHTTFTYTYFVNKGKPRDVKNAANVIHSIDAYIMRSLVRRCNYDQPVFALAQEWIQTELMERACQGDPMDAELSQKELYYYQQYERSTVVDIVIVPHLTQAGLRGMSSDYLVKLNNIIATMLEHKPFPVVTVHDDFKAHPNNINWLRKHYRNILAELADSDLLSDLLSQLYKTKGTYQKRSYNLSEKILKSNYALC